LRVLADILFPGKGRKKGSEKWSHSRVLLLSCRVKELEAERPGLSDSDLAHRIWKRFRGEYKSSCVVRQRLAEARARDDVFRNSFKMFFSLHSEEGVREELKRVAAEADDPADNEWDRYASQQLIKMAEERLKEIEAEKQKAALAK
jgi:hypothetical protein